MVRNTSNELEKFKLSCRRYTDRDKVQIAQLIRSGAPAK